MLTYVAHTTCLLFISRYYCELNDLLLYLQFNGWGFPSDQSFGSKITRLAHFRFRTLTMQMCCRIVDLNYLTL